MSPFQQITAQRREHAMAVYRYQVALVQAAQAQADMIRETFNPSASDWEAAVEMPAGKAKH